MPRFMYETRRRLNALQSEFKIYIHTHVVPHSDQEYILLQLIIKKRLRLASLGWRVSPEPNVTVNVISDGEDGFIHVVTCTLRHDNLANGLRPFLR